MLSCQKHAIFMSSLDGLTSDDMLLKAFRSAWNRWCFIGWNMGITQMLMSCSSVLQGYSERQDCLNPSVVVEVHWPTLAENKCMSKILFTDIFILHTCTTWIVLHLEYHIRLSWWDTTQSRQYNYKTIRKNS